MEKHSPVKKKNILGTVMYVSLTDFLGIKGPIIDTDFLEKVQP